MGAELVRVLDQRGYVTFASTRRQDTLSTWRIYLDFESSAPFQIPPEIDYAFLVAAATNYDHCETDPSAWRINVESIPQLAALLLEQGVFVTFISTNSVFGGERPWPGEDDPHAPGIAYARQKAEGEKAIRTAAHRLEATDRLNIVRLTKILATNTPPLPTWFSAWKRGETVQPFSDLVFAPMSLRFVANSLATIGEKRIPGNLHFSGAENITYVALANSLAENMGINSDLISPTTAVEKSISILFKPRYSGLGMTRTTAQSGISPQSLADVVSDLIPQRMEGDPEIRYCG